MVRTIKAQNSAISSFIHVYTLLYHNTVKVQMLKLKPTEIFLCFRYSGTRRDMYYNIYTKRLQNIVFDVNFDQRITPSRILDSERFG